MAHLLLSAAHKSSGKTTLALGLCGALKRQGLAVQPFKKGPDYIDPMWLTLAAGRPCHNLDFHTMAKDEIRGTFRRVGVGADISLIEGNKGLYDGLDLEGRNSNAALARLLKAPVVLVLDARGMTRGVAPLILGYQAFDPKINIAGVILNKLGGRRHEGKLRAVIEHYTDVPVIGAVHYDPALEIAERHLGLIPSNESAAAERQVDRMAEGIAAQVDLARLRSIAQAAPATHVAAPETARRHWRDVRIGIARDAAFGFYYPDDLQALRNAGAELVPFDTLRDVHLPSVDGLFIGGGFPESHLEALEANQGLRTEIATAVEVGMPVYAECGGLMYLSRRLTWQGRTRAMVGALPADVVMHPRPQGRGYVRLRETGRGPWPGTVAGGEFCAHEFHYSALENLGVGIDFAYEVVRGQGITGKHDGLVYKNVLAGYAHLRDTAGNRWTERFVDFVRNCKAAQGIALAK